MREGGEERREEEGEREREGRKEGEREGKRGEGLSLRGLALHPEVRFA